MSQIQQPLKSKRPSTLSIWITASRPHTLTASISPCLVGFSLAPQTPWNWKAAWLIFCITVQLGTNLHNDYSDFVQGADTKHRVGQARATAQGWWTPEETCRAATGVLTVTFLSGVYLLHASQQLLSLNFFAWFVVLSSIVNAFLYTGGPYPFGRIIGNFSLAYAGLGDLFVLLYFGLAAVLMLPYLEYCNNDNTLDDTLLFNDWISQLSWATATGLLATNIIVVNNLRDRHTDVCAKKRTTAVRFGKRFSLAEYLACEIFAYAICIMQAVRWNQPWFLLPLASLPLAFQVTKGVFRLEGQALNPYVGGSAIVELTFCILLSTAIALARR